jgi:SAM-dependent methyltransferase
MKLDIGCGPYKKPGYVGVDFDLQPGVDVVADTTALPFADSTIEHIHTRNTLEHIPRLFDALREFYRVSADGATIEITVPHFSSYEYWRDLTHIRPFSVYTFDHFDRHRVTSYPLPDYIPEVDFEVVRTVLDWWDPQQVTVKRGWKKLVLKLLNSTINGIANAKPFLCERFWCWGVGGFVLVTFHLRVHKPLRQY